MLGWSSRPDSHEYVSLVGAGRAAESFAKRWGQAMGSPTEVGLKSLPKRNKFCGRTERFLTLALVSGAGDHKN